MVNCGSYNVTTYIRYKKKEKRKKKKRGERKYKKHYLTLDKKTTIK